MIRSIIKNNNFNEKFPFNTIFSNFKSENLPRLNRKNEFSKNIPNTASTLK